MRSVSCDFYLKAMCVSRLCSFQSWDYSQRQGDCGAPQPLPRATFRKLACLLWSFALIFGETSVGTKWGKRVLWLDVTIGPNAFIWWNGREPAPNSEWPLGGSAHALWSLPLLGRWAPPAPGQAHRNNCTPSGAGRGQKLRKLLGRPWHHTY